MLAASTAGAATITVNATGDGVADNGNCSLREAITSANTDTASGAMADECAAGSGADSIVFDVAGPGPHVITPATALPVITETVSIDGSTDTGEVVVDGSVANAIGFEVRGDGSTIRGMTITRWSWGIQAASVDSVTLEENWIGTNMAGDAGFGNTSRGIDVASANNTVISDNVVSGNSFGVYVRNDSAGTRLVGNLIGTDPTGSSALANTSDAVLVSVATGTEIGGPGAGDGNVIAAGTRGIYVGGPAADTLISSNLIGTDITGEIDLGNTFDGIELRGNVERTIIEGNLVSGNGGSGILLYDWLFEPTGPSDSIIRANRIGVDLDDGTPIPNAGGGITINPAFTGNASGNVIGGTTGLTPGGPCTGDCNLIAANGARGVTVREGDIAYGDGNQAPILGNEIRDNSGLGIDLVEPFGVNLNDPGDLDIGANEAQNFPVLEAALTRNGQTLLTGSLDSIAETDYRVEVFRNESADASGYGEGQTFLGTFEVTTGVNGIGRIAGSLEAPATAGDHLSATATRLDGSAVPLYTSEFSLLEQEGCDQSDTLEAGLLVAAGGGEVLCGLGGDDVLRGSTGGDILDGGEGSDTADLSLSPDSVEADLSTGRVVSADGVDLLVSIENLVGSPGADQLIGDAEANVIEGGAGADTIIAGAGDDVINIADGEADAVVDCGPGNDVVNADSIDVDLDSIYIGCETINRPPSAYKCGGLSATILGTNASETITGTSGRDIIVARGGADTILGKGGNDVICAGDGNDTVKGGDGNDIIYGQNGADELVGEGGNDDLFGGDGNDDLFGGDGADLLDGGNGADLLDGRAGADTLKGKAGADTLKGGAGNDTLLGGDGNDTLRGGDGKDTLKGEKGNDTLKGEGGTDKLFGGDGKDTLFGGSGNKDLLFGQAGFDKLNGGSGKGDVCNGGSGKDRKSAPGCEKVSLIP